jgi:hypothetical protein
MALEEEDPGESGAQMYPLVAHETFVSREVLCGLVVHYLESPVKLLAGEHLSLPLVMRPEMAREIAAALLKAADEAQGGPHGETSH